MNSAKLLRGQGLRHVVCTGEQGTVQIDMKHSVRVAGPCSWGTVHMEPERGQ